MKKILIIEDEELIRDELSILLSRRLWSRTAITFIVWSPFRRITEMPCQKDLR